MSGKEELHRLVDDLPSDQVESAKRVLADLCGEGASGFGQGTGAAPERPVEEILKRTPIH